MICPGCGYENKHDALVCNLCQKVLRREKAEPPPYRAEERRAPAIEPGPEPEPEEPRRVPIPFLVLGVVLVLWGATVTMQRFRALTFPTYPQVMQPEEALARSGYAYVRWDPSIVRKDDAIFRVSDSRFSSFDPRVSLDLASPAELIAQSAKALGTYTRVSGVLPMLQYFVLTQKRVTYDKNAAMPTSEKTEGRRIYAPVVGTGARLWVLSKWFGPSIDVKAEPWLSQAAYAGIVAPLSQDVEFARLSNEWQRSTGSKLPEGALVLIDQPPPAAEKVSHMYPLGPSNELWIEVPDDADLELGLPEGVLDLTLDGAWAVDGVKKAVEKQHGKGAPIPKRVRTILQTTPAEFARIRALPGRVSPFGVTLVALGLLLVGYTGFRLVQRR